MTNTILLYAVIAAAAISAVLVSGCTSYTNSTTTTTITTTESTTTTQLMVTIYCNTTNCTGQQIPIGAGTLVQGCFRNLGDCLNSRENSMTIYCKGNNCAPVQVPDNSNLLPGCYFDANTCMTATATTTLGEN